MKKRTLDLNALEQPVLELTLKDTDHTVVRVKAPTEELVERVQGVYTRLGAVIEKKDASSTAALFELAAEFMNENMEDITFTAESLRDVYKLKLYDLMAIFTVYMEFIDDIKNAKN
jgi:hypothetical protein